MNVSDIKNIIRSQLAEIQIAEETEEINKIEKLKTIKDIRLSDINDNDNLISKGFSARNLAYLYCILQEKFEVKFSVVEIKDYRFSTIEKIADYVMEKRVD